jgi:hypothetical protein
MWAFYIKKWINMHNSSALEHLQFSHLKEKEKKREK